MVPVPTRPETPARRIDLQIPKDGRHGGVSTILARGPVAAVGVEADSTLLMVASQVYAGRGVCLEVLEGAPRRHEVFGAYPALSVLATARRLTAWMPPRVGALLVTLTPPARTETLAAEGARVEVRGGKLGKPAVVLRNGRAALVFDVREKEPWRLDLEVLAGYRLAGFAVVPGASAEWVARLGTQARWDFIDDAPLSAQGATSIRLEVKER